MVKNYAGGLACESCCTEGPLLECYSAFDLCSSPRDGFTNIYAWGTEKTQKVKERESVEVSAGGSQVLFFFSPEPVE